MLTFRLDEYFWVAKTRLPSWAGFQSRGGAYGAEDSASPADGSVMLVFAPEGRDESPLTDDEIATAQWVLDNEAIISRAVLDGLLSRYPDLRNAYCYDETEQAACMPEVSSPDGFRSLIGLYSVNVHPLVRDGAPYVGFEFGCTWDEEHGLGVLMHGERFVDIGGASTAFLLWIAEQDARARSSNGD